MNQNIKIVVLHRGWVVVGEIEQTEPEIVARNAAIIRRWGTTKGLGEIAEHGPRQTVLDPAGTVRAKDYVLMIDCAAEKWQVLNAGS